MNILITGVLGHIGSALLNNILKNKKIKKIYLVDNARSNNINVLFNLKKILKESNLFWVT
jgi:nucleoside-diphosphate-sugar epimerase